MKDAKELIADIKRGYDTLRFYDIFVDGKLWRSGYIHDTDFSKVAAFAPLARIVCNGCDITDAIKEQG